LFAVVTASPRASIDRLQSNLQRPTPCRRLVVSLLSYNATRLRTASARAARRAESFRLSAGLLIPITRQPRSVHFLSPPFSIALAGLLAALPAWLHAQAEAPAIDLRGERALGAGRGVLPAGAQGAAALYARAEKVSGSDEMLELTGDAELRKAAAVLRADHIIYTIASDELHGDGHVRVFRDGAVFSGPAMMFKTDAQTGSMPETQFNYVPRNAHGSARLAEFLPGEIARLTDAEISTCPIDDRSWWVKAMNCDRSTR